MTVSTHLRTVAGASAVLMLAFAAAWAVPPKATGDPEVIATVNGQNVTRTEIGSELIEDQIARLSASMPQFADQQRPIAGAVGALVLKELATEGSSRVAVSRKQMIDFLFSDKSPVVQQAVMIRLRQIAITQAAKAAGVTATPAEVAAETASAIKRAKSQYSMQAKTDAQFLAASGFRAKSLRDGISAQVLLDKMARKEMEKKAGRPLGPQDYLDASHILIKVNPTTAASDKPGESPKPPTAAETEKAFADARAKIDTIAKEIASGAKTFEKAASEYGEDGTKFKNGSLGVFVRGQMVKAFEDAAFALPQGKVSEPVRTQFGWHLIRVDRLGKDIPAADRSTALDAQLQSRRNALVSEIMAKAKITNRIGSPAPPPVPQERD